MNKKEENATLKITENIRLVSHEKEDKQKTFELLTGKRARAKCELACMYTRAIVSSPFAQRYLARRPVLPSCEISGLSQAPLFSFFSAIQAPANQRPGRGGFSLFLPSSFSRLHAFSSAARLLIPRHRVRLHLSTSSPSPPSSLTY